MVATRGKNRRFAAACAIAALSLLFCSCSNVFGMGASTADGKAGIDTEGTSASGKLVLSVFIPEGFSGVSVGSRAIAPETAKMRLYLNDKLFAAKTLADGVSSVAAGGGTNWKITLDVPVPVGGKYDSVKLVFLNADSKELSAGESKDVTVAVSGTMPLSIGCLPVSTEPLVFTNSLASSNPFALGKSVSKFYAFPVKAKTSYDISSTTASTVRLSLFDGVGAKVNEAVTPAIATQISASGGTWYAMANAAADIDGFVISVKEWNQAPIVADFAASAVQGTTGNAITFAAPVASDPEGTTLSYSWTATGPAPSLTTVNSGSGTSLSCSFATAGEYTVSLIVKDEGGAETKRIQKAFIGMSNVPPVAVAGPDVAVNAGQSVAFDASASKDLNTSDSLFYDWDFGDGSTGTGITPSHLYAVGGVYKVKLKVSDAEYYSEDDQVVTVNGAPIAKTGLSKSAMVNDLVIFSGALCSDPENDPLAFDWDFGDGSVRSSLRSPSHKYGTAGSFNATLVVTDSKGLSAQATIGVTIREYGNPVAEAGPNIGINAGATASVNATASYSPSGAALSYDWDFGDGSVHVSTAAATHVYAFRGTYTATLTVTDTGTMKIGSDSLAVSVNGKPTARALVSNPSPAKDVSITFNGATSSDPENDALTYEWDFGDSSAKSTVASPSHSYATAGPYTAKLTIKDPKGLSDSADLLIFVRTPGEPKAEAGDDRYANPDVSLAFSGAASRADTPSTISTYAWDFGDGSTGSGVDSAHTYVNGGVYLVKLTVTDSAGKSASDTAKVNINCAPIAKASASVSIAESGVPIGFSASGSSDPDGDKLSYEWSFSDGAKASGVNATHAFSQGLPAPGLAVTATLKVSDPRGLSSSSKLDLTVISYVAPTADAGLDRMFDPGEALGFSAAGTKADVGLGIVNYAWDFGDGTTAVGPNPVHSFAEGGPYTVTLTVTDSKNRTGSDTATITSSSYRISVATGAGTTIDAANPLLLLIVDNVGGVNPMWIKKLTAPGTIMLESFPGKNRLLLVHDIGGNSPGYDSVNAYLGKGDFVGSYYGSAEGKVGYSAMSPTDDSAGILTKGESYSLTFKDVSGSLTISFQ